ncbi:unnamed protein product [Allacma fusca]|uniref:Uncharacterized protein n=1 Tax=Allacma fusca TaxID=39272 RepID=A0A8J2J5I1_9HEXA|nr:unnamed protein product [Allacma fusca]
MTTTVYNQQQSTIMMSNTQYVKKSELNTLIKALNDGDYSFVNTVLTKRQIGKERSRIGRTALHYIAENGNTDCLELLTSLGDFDLNAFDHEGHTGLHLAVINGNRDSVQILINAKANINCLDHEKHSLVHWATVCGESEILSLLLLNGSNASTMDIHNATPLHYAAQMCGHIKSQTTNNMKTDSNFSVSKSRALIILRQLVQHGVNVRVKDQDGREPLLWAASAGSSEAILALVNAGASTDAEDKDGLTALHCAASRGHTDCLETLIGLCGCNVDIIDHNGCTALFYAVTLGHPDCTELLLNYGSEPNRQDRKGRTPAHCASSKGQLETIKQIHKHGANLWMRNVRGELPLHEAILSRRKELVVWLLSQRPEAVNSTNNDGRTCLHLAALSNNVQMVKILLDHSADVNAVMRNGKGNCMTPMDAALHRGNSAVAKFLQIHGGVSFNSLNDPKFMNRMLLNQSRSNIDSRLSNNMINNSRLSYNNMTNIQCNTPDNHVVLTPDYIISSTPIQQYYQHDVTAENNKKLMLLIDGETPIPANEAHINRTDESEGFHIDSYDEHNITEVEREIIREDDPQDELHQPTPDSEEVIEEVIEANIEVTPQQEHALRQLREEAQQTDDHDMNEAYVELVNKKKTVRIVSNEASQTDFPADYQRRMPPRDIYIQVQQPLQQDCTPERPDEDVPQKGGSVTAASTSYDDQSADENKGQTEETEETDEYNKGASVDETQETEDTEAQYDDQRKPANSSEDTEETSDQQVNETEDTDEQEDTKVESNEDETDDGEKELRRKPSYEQQSRYKEESREEEETEETDDPSQTQDETTEIEADTEPGEVKPEIDPETALSPEQLLSKNKPDNAESDLLESAQKTRYRKNKNIKSAHYKSNGKNSKKFRKSRSIETKTVPNDVEYVKKERTIKHTKSMSPVGKERRHKEKSVKGYKSVSPSMMTCDDGYMSSRSVSLDIGSAGSSRRGSIASDDDTAGERKSHSRKTRKSTAKTEAASRSPSKENSKSRSNSQKSEPDIKSRSNSHKSQRSDSHISDSKLSRSGSKISEKAEKPKSRSESRKTSDSQSRPHSRKSPEDSSRPASRVSAEKNSRSNSRKSSDGYKSRQSSRKASATSRHSRSHSQGSDVDIIEEKMETQVTQEQAEIPRAKSQKSVEFESRPNSDAEQPQRSNSRKSLEEVEALIHDFKPLSRQNSQKLLKSRSQSREKLVDNTDEDGDQVSSINTADIDKKETSLKKSSRCSPINEKTSSRPDDENTTSGGTTEESSNEEQKKLKTKKLTPPLKSRRSSSIKSRYSQGSHSESNKSDPGDTTAPSEKSKTKIPKPHQKKDKNNVNSAIRTRKSDSQSNSDSNLNSATDEIEYGAKISLQEAVKNRKSRSKSKSRTSIPAPVKTPAEKKGKQEYSYDGKVVNGKIKKPKSKSEGRKPTTKSIKTEPSRKLNSEERELQIQNKIMSGKKQSVLYEMNKVDKLDKQIYSRSTSRMNEAGATQTYGRVIEGKGTDINTPVSVTQAIQVSMRKYALERHIFSQLLELKRLDTENNNRTTEQIIVKRLVESNRRAGLHHHFRDFDSHFTFRNYEKYLYDQLKLLQAGNKKLQPRFAPSDDIEKLASALKSFNKTTFPYIHNTTDENSNACAHTTHKCHHAAHAYTGVPCAAYIPKPSKYAAKRGGKGASNVSRLPRVNPAKAPGPIQKEVVSAKEDDMPTAPSPITLHLQQGDKKSIFQLPNDTELDPSKNYYVSLSIKPTNSNPGRNGVKSEDGINLNQSI